MILGIHFNYNVPCHFKKNRVIGSPGVVSQVYHPY